MAGNLAFENAYAATPTWDIGRAQPALTRLLDRHLVGHAVLDAGCGTGDAALDLAALGHDVTGVDFSPTAIEKARAKARQRGLTARFVVADALRLADMISLRAAFDTAIDVGLLHSLQPADWPAYAAALGAVIRPGGNLLLLCWSDGNPFGRGPERVSKRDIRRTFRDGDGWRIEAIEPETLETLLPEGRVQAWLARIRRVAST